MAGGIDIVSYESVPEGSLDPTAAQITLDHYVWQGRQLVTSGTDVRTVPFAAGQSAGDVAFPNGTAFDCPQLFYPS